MVFSPTFCKFINVFVVVLGFCDGKRMALRGVQQVVRITQYLRDVHETLQVCGIVILEAVNLAHLREIIRWIEVQMLNRHPRTYQEIFARVNMFLEYVTRESGCCRGKSNVVWSWKN